MLMMVKLILAFLSVIAILCLSLILGNVAEAAPYGAGVYNADVPYGGQTQLTISTSGAVALAVIPSDSGVTTTASGTVTVVSTDVVGYKLYIRSAGSTDMNSGAATIPTSANGTPGTLAMNTWGYNLNASSDFVGMTTSDILIRSANQPYTSGDVTTVTYGVKLNYTKPAGSYTTSIIYTAVPQTN